MLKFQNIPFFVLAMAFFIGCGEADIRETKHYNGIRKTQVAYKNEKPHGEFKRWTSHGDLAESGIYKNGLREGEWTEWFTDGKVLSRGNYENGKKEGIWKGFFHDGKIAWEHEFKNDEPAGIWTEFYASGNLKEKSSCFKNTEKGTRKIFGENGKKEFEENCRHGILHGEQKKYYPGGALESVSHYRDGTLEGSAELFRASGELWRKSFYHLGIRESLWTYYAKDGSVEKTSIFKNGNGIAYGELGNQGIDAETTFVNNRIQDTLHYTLPERKLKFEEIWQNDEKVKLIARYAKGNRLATEGNFKNGKRNGFWRNWYANGKLKDSLFYKDDEPFGEQLYYDSTGKLYMRKSQQGLNGPTQVQFE